MASNQLSQLLPAIFRTAPWDEKAGELTIPWQLFFQALASAANGGGGGGNTVITTDFGVDDFRNMNDQQIADLQQQLLYLNDDGALAVALEAVQVQQSNNAVNTAGDVLDLIRLSEAGIILNGASAYLGAVSDSAANIDWYVASNDINSAAVNANAQIGFSNSTAEMVLMGPPDGVAVQAMDVQFMTITNNDTINANIQLYVSTAGSNTHVLQRVLLTSNTTLIFDENGFRVLSNTGLQFRG